MARLPDSGAEAIRWLFVALGLGFLVIVGYYAVNALLAVGVAAVILLIGGLAVWVVGGRLWDALRHGKPLVRTEWQDDGGNN